MARRALQDENSDFTVYYHDGTSTVGIATGHQEVSHFGTKKLVRLFVDSGNIGGGAGGSTMTIRFSEPVYVPDSACANILYDLDGSIQYDAAVLMDTVSPGAGALHFRNPLPAGTNEVKGWQMRYLATAKA